MATHAENIAIERLARMRRTEQRVMDVINFFKPRPIND
jgi:hypothetical protein